jgi:nucleoside-diphosphate-sugar epimerase
MYAVDRYVSVNDHGTAVLFQQLIECPVKRVVVASSMSIYGEGLYRTADGALVEDAVRRPRAGADAPWDPVDDRGRPLVPVPTPEWKRPALASVYAITKHVQERLTLTLAPAYGMEGVALRLWNVYGPGQALSNPYTGVLAIFASRIHNGQAPMIFEDGEQRRDFVHVEDIARAFLLALDHPRAAGEVYNIASGEDRSVEEVAALLAESGIGATVVDPRWVVPIHASLIDLAAAHRLVVTVEDGVRVGGVGTRLRQDLRAAGVDTALNEVGLPDAFLPHAERAELLAATGLTAGQIARDIIDQIAGTKLPAAKPAVQRTA